MPPTTTTSLPTNRPTESSAQHESFPSREYIAGFGITTVTLDPAGS